jgi:putative flippase GtrA
MLRILKHEITGEFLRYFAASGIALGVDFGLLIFLTEVFGVHYLLSAAIGFSVGILIIYILSVTWVFRYRKHDSKHAEFVFFLAIGMFGLGLNEVMMWGATDGLGLHYQLSKVITTGFVFLSNFLLRKFLLFHNVKVT